MFLELKVWKFWGFAKFSNLVKGMDLNLETLNLRVIVLETVDIFWNVFDGERLLAFQRLVCG